jgi:hypothetical protein
LQINATAMGFLKKQQINIAVRLLAWQYEKQGQPMPDYTVLESRARKLVTDAHHIAKERGGNLLGILKEMASDIRKHR